MEKKLDTRESLNWEIWLKTHNKQSPFLQITPLSNWN
jgi:hypothetical protein